MGFIHLEEGKDRTSHNIESNSIADVHFINFLFAIGPDSYQDSGLKILY